MLGVISLNAEDKIPNHKPGDKVRHQKTLIN